MGIATLTENMIQDFELLQKYFVLLAITNITNGRVIFQSNSKFSLDTFKLLNKVLNIYASPPSLDKNTLASNLESFFRRI